MYVTFHGQWGWQVLHVEHGHARAVAGAVDQAHADRIAELLSLHGPVDVPLDQNMIVLGASDHAYPQDVG